MLAKENEGEKKKDAARVTADESLTAVSADLDKLTRMLGTCLSPVSRVNFASLYAVLALSLPFSRPFSRDLSLLSPVSSPMRIDIAEARAVAVQSVKWVFRRSPLALGDPPVWTLRLEPFARDTRKMEHREGEREREWDQNEGRGRPDIKRREQRDGEGGSERRRVRSFVSRGAEVGIQALLSGAPFLRVSRTLSSRRISYVKDSVPGTSLGPRALPYSSSASSSSSSSASASASFSLSSSSFSSSTCSSSTAAAPRPFSVSLLTFPPSLLPVPHHR